MFALHVGGKLFVKKNMSAVNMLPWENSAVTRADFLTYTIAHKLSLRDKEWLVGRHAITFSLTC